MTDTNTASGAAILFEHEDGRYAVNPDTAGDPAWHRLGPVDISALVPAQAASSDAYDGAREDLSIWKRRALEAERDLRAEKETSARLVAELNAANGPTSMIETVSNKCNHGDTHIVHDCLRCGAPVCCGKCCAAEATPSPQAAPLSDGWHDGVNAAAPAQPAQPAAGAVAGPTPDVQTKIDSNTWDHFGDILPTLKTISHGDWYWGANSRCKYIEIRIDTRDGGCILYDRNRVRISPEQFAFQAGGGCGKMEPWTASNSLAAAPSQPSPAGMEDAARLDWLLWKLPGDSLRYVVGDLSDTSDAAEFRAAIDAARAQQKGQNHE